MQYLYQNLKLLRKRKKLSQEQLAEILGVSRSSVNAYENQLADPTLPTLIKISDHFKVSIDRLLKQNMKLLSEMELGEIERGLDVDIQGKRLRILSTTVDAKNKNLVDLIPEKAKAGYVNGYADIEFLRDLPKVQLPFLNNNKQYRVFPISGDSMPPVANGSYVVAEYVDNWNEIKDLQAYIVLTQSEGIVFKLLKNRIHEEGVLHLISTNPNYAPYTLGVEDLLEIWKFKYYISPDLDPHLLSENDLKKALLQVQSELVEIKNKLK